MKKIIFTFLVLLSFSDMVLAQDGDWVGNTNLSMFTRLDNSEAIIAPRQINPEMSGKITSLKFYHHPYQEYNTTSYTINIYEDIDLQWYNEGLHLYEYSSCGDKVYTQEYTASGDGWQTVVLDSAYVIPEGDFWVGVKMNGMGTLAFGDADNAVVGQYFFSDMYNYNWYWSPTYFFDSGLWQDVLYSLGMAVFVEEIDHTAVNEMADLQVSVYPNPAADKVRIEASGMNQIIVCDLAGRVIRDITTSCDDVTLDVSDLQSALYLLRIVTAEGSAVQRLSVVR